MRTVTALVVLALLDPPLLTAQRRATPPRKPATPPAPATIKVAPDVTCPAPLGEGATTKRSFCDVVTGRAAAEGILIDIPPHVGEVVLTFDLHNRQTYSEEQVRAKRAYARYTATIAVVTMENVLIDRAVVQSEFRSAVDLVDRITGGAGPGGMKAVAPTGLETISITIPETQNRVSILGEKVTIDRVESSATYYSSGRPIAIISNVVVEYRPPPAAPATTKKPR
jgi:hypothetical protein